MLNKNWLAIIFSALALMVSLSAFLFSIYIYYKFLPLDQANLIFSKENIKINILDKNNCPATKDKDIDYNKCAQFDSYIENTGNAVAKDISFKVYMIPVNGSFKDGSFYTKLNSRIR